MIRMIVDTPVSDVPTARATLQSCITDVGDWCSSHRLQLYETKTELIWFCLLYTSDAADE